MPPSPTGRYLDFGAGAERYRAFVPDELPPTYELNAEDYDLMERARLCVLTRAVARASKFCAGRTTECGTGPARE